MITNTIYIFKQLDSLSTSCKLSSISLFIFNGGNQPNINKFHLTMKSFILLCAIIIYVQTFTIAPLRSKLRQVPLTAGQIIPGHGYSMDRQSMSSIACFRVQTSPYSKSESVIRFDQGSTFSEIQKSLRIDVSVKNGSGVFSVDADIAFMKEIMDTDYSMSINYYQYVQSELSMEMGYGPAGALTQDGLRVYGPVDNPNPRFGLLCGDKYINSFKVGANLVYSLKLHFQSHNDKTTFEAKMGKKFGSFMNIALDIQATAKQLNTSGKVEIMAYQSGGKPADLAKLLNSTCGSDYCAASCSFTNMKDCIGSMNGLLKYSSENFPAQINIQDPTTVAPFAVGFADLQDVKWLGLETPKSFITKDVIDMRQTLANTLFANQYYIDTFTLLAQTKLNWDKDSTLFRTILSIPSQAKLNIQLLMDQIQGGIVCYKSPQTCIDQGQQIISKLRPIEAEAKAIFEKIRYKISPDFCKTTFYRISDEKWYASGPGSGCRFFNISHFTASSTMLSYNMTAVQDNGFHTVATVGSLISEGQSAPYVGMRHDEWPRNNKTLPTQARKEISQYSFQLYK